MIHNCPEARFFSSPPQDYYVQSCSSGKKMSIKFVCLVLYFLVFLSKLTLFDWEMLYCWVIHTYTVHKETWTLHYARIQCTSKDKSETKPVRNDKTGIVVLLLSLTELVVAVLAILCVCEAHPPPSMNGVKNWESGENSLWMLNIEKLCKEQISL